jgi:hypothetical protein
VRHPEVTVELTGHHDDSVAVLERVMEALRQANVPVSEVRQYLDEATEGDYNHLLRTTLRWVNVE